MASSFFALLDDISVLMDDVATMSKVATEKTAGILGDDLAVNAEKSSDFLNSRELPVLWQITKASLLNDITCSFFAKCICSHRYYYYFNNGRCVSVL